MSIQFNKMSLDMGVVTANAETALAFYCDTLGLELAATIPVPGGVVKRLKCGDSVIKLLILDKAPPHAVQAGGYAAATGFRYCTLSVKNLDELAEKCRVAGYRIAVKPFQLRPGVQVAMVEDPDGNTIEFMQEG